jgi:hypothetical protein
MRYVHAEGFLVEIVTRGGKGSGAAAHTHIAELATSAFSLEIIRIAKLIEYE